MSPAILNHLWQSTLVALAAALLTLAFRKASAGVRYGLWFAASVKFLVPFAALAALGGLLAPEIHAPAVTAPQAAFITRAAQPFSQAQRPQAPPSYAEPSPISPLPTSAPAPVHAAPRLDPGLILLAVWAIGCVAVLARWMVRSARVRIAVRSATPLAWSAPMPVLASSSLWEPGLVGLWRPVLLVPESLPDYLAQPELDAIVAHEACHLRRRDNLTAAIHMLVEALFWFHPLVWWIGARLIEERERACDEAVVRSGHNRAAYARSLVESCRLYLQSPLSCVAGASGSNLKTRVEAIMTALPSPPLSIPKKALLVAAAVCAIATPVAAGLLTTPAQLTAAVHAVAMASGLAPARRDDARSGPESAPQEGAATPAIMMARIKAILAPEPAVATIDDAPLSLSRDVQMRLAALPPFPSAPQPVASEPAQASAPSAPSAQPAGPADAAQALSFVRSYAAATRDRHMIARWSIPVCVGITGLPSDQAAAVRARVEAVAGAVGVGVQPAGCRPNVDIRFSAEPQRTLDDVIAHKGWLLGDSTSDTRAVKAVTLPVQAWYETNGVEFAAARTGGLKALISYQAPAEQTYLQSIPPVGMTAPPAPPLAARQFLNVLVIVDQRRAGNRDPGLISDYVAMLALSQPRSADHCNVLPSVTDLFAGACPGRGEPHGLTPADGAYLTALYTADPVGRAFESQQQGIAHRMVQAQIAAPLRDVLSNRRAAVRPQAAVVRPASAPAAQAMQPADPTTQALRFVQSYAASTRERHMIARWGNAVCVKVVGLTPDQAGAVRARVEAVARAVGVGVQPAGCQRSNIEIGFSAEPQQMLDTVVARQAEFLGDGTSDTRTAKTVTQPIQAWYVTNGAQFAANPADDLKVRVLYQDPTYFTTGPGATGDGGGAGGIAAGASPTPGPARSGGGRQFLNVMMIVDLRRTGDMSLGLISDDVAMLALSQPRSLDTCNVLPSVTDLFAGACPGRGEPHGLTPADDAYLAALYAADPVDRVFESQQAAIAHRMIHPQIGLAQSAILSNPRVVVR
jgi:beta-lactamase regulating signal transducer with metallopeptidase domain